MPVSQFFVNLPSVADRKDPNEPGFAIDFIDEAKPSHLVFPKPVNSRRSGLPENGFELKDRTACLTLRFNSGGRHKKLCHVRSEFLGPTKC